MSSNELKKDIKRAAKKVLPDPAIRKIRAYRKTRKGSEPKPNTYRSSQTYTVVTAVYNVEAYLDDFFTSLYNQTMFKESIRVIAVDDGSTDLSAEIIKRWQDRWPGAITYLKKENGGQASARNLGMNHTESEWVTFIDPDDFVSKRYFEEVDRAIVAWPSVQMVSCRLVYFFEKGRRYSDTHPLNNNYKHGDKFYSALDEHIPMQFSMSTAFFKMSVIKDRGLKISEDIKPNFEDGHFVGRYLLELTAGVVGFLSKPRYYYRKRESGTSTIDGSWRDTNKLISVPRYGYLDLLQYSKRVRGFYPVNIQKTILYDLSYYLGWFVNRPQRSRFAEEAGVQEEFLDLLREIFACIDTKVLFDFPGRFLRFAHKAAISQFFMTREPPYQIAYVTSIDLPKKLIHIRTCSKKIAFYLDGKVLTPIRSKRVGNSFFGVNLYDTYELSFKFERQNQVLSYVGKKRESARLTVDGKQFENSLSVREAIRRYTRNWSAYEQKGSTWIIMDRDTQADDNGEHFYRYMMRNHPEQRCLFALRKESPDWKRLAQEGFNLLNFGSKAHELELRKCSMIISSHADNFVHSYFQDNFFKSKKFIFLQHGLTVHNLSTWLNGKPISLLAAASTEEYHSFVNDGSPYEIAPESVTLSGFPRHDALLKMQSSRRFSQQARHAIMIAPTWRASLVGNTLGLGNNREFKDSFLVSEYKETWESFLNNSTLKKLAKKNSCEVLFVPHANIAPYIETGAFSVPDYITVHTNNRDRSIQECFCSASVCITDYSSMAFDVAYLGKECIFYQFDREFFYGGAQVYSQGYFDYERDGFGPVVDNENDLLAELEKLAARDFKPDDVYKKRMEETFAFRDGKCCERVYEAIMQLDEPRS